MIGWVGAAGELVRVSAPNEPVPECNGLATVDVPAAFLEGTVTWDAVSQTFVAVDRLAEAKARSWEDAKAARNAAASGGCETPLGRVDTTDASRVLITGAVQMAQLSSGAYAVDWTMADNSKVTHDGPAMIAMGVAVAQHIAACWAHGQALREAIDAASTAEALDSIDINAGWPGR